MARTILILLFCASVCGGCRKNNEQLPVVPTEPVRELTPLEKQVVAADNTFGFKLFNEVNKNELKKNVFISPFSVSFALGMALNGADGSTRDAMKSAMGVSGMSDEDINVSFRSLSAYITGLDPKVEISIANSLWYDNDFRVEQRFVDALRTYFDAETAALDFASPDALTTINGWVNRKTNGKIPTLLEEIGADEVLFLVNALYFKGAWKFQFNPNNTRDDQFTTASNVNVPCKMMWQKGTFPFTQNSRYAAADLPYANGNYVMTFVVPYSDPIDQFVDTFTEAEYDSLKANLKETQIDVYIPRFTLEYSAILNAPLSTLGMGIAFTEYADFSRISKELALRITRVIHKTFVEVNEEGTTAAAVTGVGVGVVSVPPSLRADRPFLILLRDTNSGAILFMGKIANTAS